MKEIYMGYTLMTMSRPFTPKELFQAVQIKRDGFTVHDCLIGNMDHAKRYVDSLRKEQLKENRDKDNCWRCDGNGEIVADCIEDSCACADPEEEHGWLTCHICDGRGWLYAED